MNQVSLFDARAARDEGIARATEANDTWMERALKKLGEMKVAGFTTTSGEGIRFWLLSNGLDEPTSPHAWGALTRTAITRGIIYDTGHVVQMRGEKSHARRTPLWRFA